MAYDFTGLKEDIDKTKDWLIKEFASIRTGRATPTLIESIEVEAYGAKSRIREVAGTTVEDPRTLRISLWDPSLIKSVEKAVEAAGLGVSVSSDERGVRVHFPELTSERRTEITRLAKKKHEEARIALKQARNKAKGEIEASTQAGTMSDDEKARLENEMQRIIDTANKDFDDLYEKKEKEILG